ncbi:hypothetical protein [Roseateles paludis]|uniref:Beta-lactamase-related domain-containing protein n=1 Tax=Roseateles paludis TaxID=3145238 RepID=A0ABV0G1E4_9BURK
MPSLRPLVLLLIVGAAHADPTPDQRVAAARLTAEKAANCVAVQPFYWEVGNGRVPLAGGSVGPAGAEAPQRNTPMAIASASKWVYAAFVAERRQGLPSAMDWSFMNFRSGYTNFLICGPNQSVAACQSSPLNGRGQQNPATVGKFDYSGGHMQEHAVLMGLGQLGPDGLALALHQTLSPVIGAGWRFDYTQAQPAGGGRTTAGDYARLLQAMVSGQLQISKLLGEHKVCTNPTVCPSEAIKTPVPLDEAWSYSFGHWVEDDPQHGDGAFSSAGAFGFYPWISADKRFYGVLAREQRSPNPDDTALHPGAASAYCGRLIRAAWMDGQPRP